MRRFFALPPASTGFCPKPVIITISTPIMISAKVRSNQTPSSLTPACAPKNAPTDAQAARDALNLKSENPFRKKPVTAEMFCAMMPIRFVPLATGPGMPRKTMTGTTRIDPPPASTLIQPEATPAANSKTTFQTSTSI